MRMIDYEYIIEKIINAFNHRFLLLVIIDVDRFLFNPLSKAFSKDSWLYLNAYK